MSSSAGAGWGRRFALVLVLILPACQPLPRPFFNDRPPASLLTVRANSVSIGPVTGKSRATAAKLGAAMAKALQKREIPASDRTTSLASYLLNGRIEEIPSRSGKSVMIAVWRLRDASGHVIGERKEQVEAASAEWDSGGDQPIADLAAASATALAPLLLDEAPVEAAVGGRTRILIDKVGGAPGDGDKALATALTTVLKRRALEIVGDRQGKPDLILDGEVSVTPAKPGQQHVKIVWRVRRPDGAEIGNVAQENDVPKGALDAAWGDVAYSVAVAADGGIADIIARGAPPPDGKSPDGKS